jgi:hypothetical protein
VVDPAVFSTQYREAVAVAIFSRPLTCESICRSLAAVTPV